MKVRSRPLVDKFSASSDLEEKLVTMWPAAGPNSPVPSGTRSVLTRCPSGVIWSRKIGEVTPKLGSARVVVEHAGIGAVGDGRRACAAGAARRQLGHSRREQIRLPRVGRAAYHQVARLEPGPEADVCLRAAGLAGGGDNAREQRGRSDQRSPPASHGPRNRPQDVRSHPFITSANGRKARTARLNEKPADHKRTLGKRKMKAKPKWPWQRARPTADLPTR